jgi:hypothetical protein
LGKIGANRKNGRDLTKNWRGLTSPFLTATFHCNGITATMPPKAKKRRKYQPPSWQRPIASFFSRANQNVTAAENNDENLAPQRILPQRGISNVSSPSTPSRPLRRIDSNEEKLVDTPKKSSNAVPALGVAVGDAALALGVVVNDDVAIGDAVNDAPALGDAVGDAPAICDAVGDAKVK